MNGLDLVRREEFNRLIRILQLVKRKLVKARMTGLI